MKKNYEGILFSYDKLAKINSDAINFEIKKTKQVIPDILGAADFYKTQENNPDYPELASSKELKLLLKTYKMQGIAKDTVIDLMVGIYPSIKDIDLTEDEAKLEELKNNKFIRRFQPSRSYDAIDRLIDTLTTTEGAKQLIRDIIVFNQAEKSQKTELYYKRTVTSDLTREFGEKPDIGIGKPLYKLNFYLLTQLKGDSKTEYIKSAQKEYKQHYEKYEEYLKKEIETLESEKKKRYISRNDR